MAKKGELYGEWIRTDERIGTGGRGDVFVAHHRDDAAHARPHALKRLRNAKDKASVARFKKEIDAALRLEHPGIVKPVFYDLGEQPFYVAPLYRKGDLTPEKVAHLTPAERLRFFAAVCHAIGAAHMHQPRIIHRDVKPANVLIADDGTPVVADFGLCLFEGDDERQTETFEVTGSRFFTAPELADGFAEEVTPAADVYSLGKLLYWLFSRGRVFEREKHRDPRHSLLGTEPRTAHAFVYQILDHTIVEDPKGRYFPDANALAADAEAVAKRLEMEAHALDLKVPQQCLYCRVGEYTIRVDPSLWYGGMTPLIPGNYDYAPNSRMEHAREQAAVYGLGALGDRPWLVLQCQACGNVQIFQLFGGAPGVDFLKNWNLRPRRP